MTQTFRNYHIPACADVPDTQVLFAQTEDFRRAPRREIHERVAVQPGRRRAGERHPRRHGARLTATPFAPDRIFRAVAAACEKGG